MPPSAGSTPVDAARTERHDESFEAASSVLKRIGKLKKQAAVANDLLSNRNALKNLRLPVLVLASLHIAPAKLVRPDGNIDEWLVIVIAQNGRIRHRNRICNRTRRHSDRAIHIL